MTAPFDASESAYTATARQIVPTPTVSIEIDFTKWGNPERSKINDALAFTNIYHLKRRGYY